MFWGIVAGCVVVAVCLALIAAVWFEIYPFTPILSKEQIADLKAIADADYDAFLADYQQKMVEALQSKSIVSERVVSESESGIKITALTLTPEAQARLCVGKEAAEAFLKAPLSDFVGSMEHFAAESVKTPENGAVTSRKVSRRRLRRTPEERERLREALRQSAENPHPESETIANEGHNAWLKDLDDKYGPYNETVTVNSPKEFEDAVCILTNNSTPERLQELAREYAPLTKAIVESVLGRPSWPKVWMNMARAIAERSYDPRLKVGCVVIPEDNTGVLSLGYNGNAMGLPNEVESSEPGKSGFLHAELNACLKLNTADPRWKAIYVTHFPCRTCCKIIIQSNINRVVYGEVYRDMSGAELLKQSGIEVLSYEDALITT